MPGPSRPGPAVAMTIQPDIKILKIEYGHFPTAAQLNHKIPKDSLLLRATLDIRWDQPDPIDAVARCEKALLAFSPSFQRHQCRGPEAYHVVPRNGGEAGSARGRTGPDQPFDGALALMHLIEHAMIDFQCAVTDQKRCSGITAAHRGTKGRYDLIVESPDYGIARCCLALALSSVTAATDGTFPGSIERDILRVAQAAYMRPWKSLTAPGLARDLGWTETRAGRALEALRDVGYLSERPQTVNISGLPDFRVSSV